MKNKYMKEAVIISTIFLLMTNIFLIMPSMNVKADSYNGEDLAIAMLANSSWLIDSSYYDTDTSGTRQSAILSSLGTMLPTNGGDFVLLSTGTAGTNIITTDERQPGDERGTWFEGGTHGYPRDTATLTLTLQVPLYMHYVYYDVQFLSAEYPEYVGSQYNDKLTVTVNSPSEGESSFIFDVNSGYFLLDSHGIPGTGFDIYAQSGYPGGVDWVDRVERTYGADAGASDLIQMGGLHHPVSPNEQITVTFDIRDTGDNLFDSAAYIDNLKFTGFAQTNMIARKTVVDLNDAPVECEDQLRYRITVSNTGSADQQNNPGNEFEDYIPENTTYVANSVTSTSGSAEYDSINDKITWNGEILGSSSVIIEFDVTVNQGLSNGSIISNQGTVFWDSDEDGTNEETELTDDAFVDDGIDLDLDGDTDDDDPTILIVTEFEYPDSVTEGFSDDAPGGNATQSYFFKEWFQTTRDQTPSSSFKVAASYHYDTTQSYKMKLRQSEGTCYWNYTAEELNSEVTWWESWFYCGDASDNSDLLLDFKNTNGANIARLRFLYEQNGDQPPLDHLCKLQYWDPIQGDWVQICSDYNNGYLRNSWYKIRLEQTIDNKIIYKLNRSCLGMVHSVEAQQINPGFENLCRVELYSTQNPIICPMFFWDEHSIGLTQT